MTDVPTISAEEIAAEPVEESHGFKFEDLAPIDAAPIVEPKAKAPRTSPKKERKVPTNKPGQFVQPLTQVYAFLGVGLMPFDAECAAAVMTSGEQCAKAWDELAQKNESVRRALAALTETGAWGGVIAAHMPIAVAVLSHHMPGAIPPILRPAPAEDASPEAPQ